MNCIHCHQKTKENISFCCHGCEVANKIVRNLNLDNYYQFCRSIYSTTPKTVLSVKNQIDFVPFIKSSLTKEGFFVNTIYLMVGHIQCGACVWLIENTLKLQHNVINARINMSTNRLSLEWEQNADQIEHYINMIEKLGYRLIPFNAEQVASEAIVAQNHLLKYIFISALATISIMMLTFGVWAGNYTGEMGKQTRTMLHILAAMIAVPSILYAGQPFFKKAFSALTFKRLNMDVPISIGIIFTLISSIFATFSMQKNTYFDAASSLLFFLLIGRFFDLKARNKALSYVQTLILSLTKSVTIDENGRLFTLDLSRVREGQIAYVAVGEKIPVDGKIISGQTTIDNSLITGESIPIDAKIGDYLNAGTVNLSNPIRIRIDKIGEGTLLGEVIKLIENAEQKKSTHILLADRVALYFTPFILAISLGTLIFWSFHTDFAEAINIATSVLVITCPCALGLAIPAAQIVASSILLKNGVYMKTSDALEKLSKIDYLIFDKTGTLTQGRLSVENMDEFTTADLQLISSIATHSKHPIAKSLAMLSKKPLLALEVKEHHGLGLCAIYKNREVMLGSAIFCGIENSDLSSFSEVWYRNGAITKRMLLSDHLKIDANKMINYFQNKLNFNCVILSGDKESAVLPIAQALGVKQFKSTQNPTSKYAFLEQLNYLGHKTLMVGDGLNDSAALKSAYLSMSPASGVEIAQNSCDIVFNGDRLEPIIIAYKVSKLTHSVVKLNFFISALYNLICIPLAICGHINPIIAAIAMSASSILVVLNSISLQFKKI